MRTSGNEKKLQRIDHIRCVDLDQVRNDPDKLYNTAVDLQQEFRRLYRDHEKTIQRESVQSTVYESTGAFSTKYSTEPSSFWSGLQWIPAERDYPTDNAAMEPSCFGSSEIDVLVYNCSNSELQVWSGLSKLQGMLRL